MGELVVIEGVVRRGSGWGNRYVKDSSKALAHETASTLKVDEAIISVETTPSTLLCYPLCREETVEGSKGTVEGRHSEGEGSIAYAENGFTHGILGCEPIVLDRDLREDVCLKEGLLVKREGRLDGGKERMALLEEERDVAEGDGDVLGGEGHKGL